MNGSLKTMGGGLVKGVALAGLLWIGTGALFAAEGKADVKKPALSGNKAILQKIYDAYNTANPTALDSLVAANAVSHDLPSNLSKGVEGFKEYVILLTRSFPDGKIRVEDMVAEGNKVAARIMFTGTHEGEFMGVPRTGRSVAYTGVHFVRFEGGKAVEHWAFMDRYSLLRQLGAAETPSPK